MKTISSLLIFSLIFGIQTTYAELHECKGVWTNRPCSEGTGKSLGEETRNSSFTIKPEGKSERESWIHDLEMKRLKAKRSYGIDISIEEARFICEDPSQNIAACRTAVTARDDAIEKGILEAKQIAPGDKKASPTPAPANQVTIIQNNNNDLIGILTPRQRGRDRDPDRHTLPTR